MMLTPKGCNSIYRILGLHTPVEGSDPENCLPPWVASLFTRKNKDGDFEFDNLIYVPGTTYSIQPVSFALIFAHELRHFSQCCEQRKALDDCTLILNQLESFWRAAGIRKWDFPHEYDAMMFSKCVAEAVCGESTVSAFLKGETEAGDPKWRGFGICTGVCPQEDMISPRRLGDWWRDSVRRCKASIIPKVEVELSDSERCVEEGFIIAICEQLLADGTSGTLG